MKDGEVPFVRPMTNDLHLFGLNPSGICIPNPTIAP